MNPPARTALRTTVHEDRAEVDSIVPAWDELTVAAGVPMAGPAFALSWWDAEDRRGSRMRVVATADADGFVGVAPFVVGRGPGGILEYRLMGAGIGHRLGPAARPGREPEFGAELARVLAAQTPRPDSVVWEGVDAVGGDEVAVAAASGWPTPLKAHLRRDGEMTSPVITLDGCDSHAEWLSTKSKNFRHKERQVLKAARRAGVVARRSDSLERLDEDLESFGRLHDERWRDRGGSSVTGPTTMATFRGMARTLLAQDRLWLYLLELDGTAIGAYLAVGAGSEIAGVALGFDESHADIRPGHQLMHAIIADACERDIVRFDLGGGAQPYKVRFADTDRVLRWSSLHPRGARWPLVRLRLAPKHLYYGSRRLLRRLPDERYEQLKRLSARLPR